MSAGVFAIGHACPDCAGDGLVDGAVCATCQGAGGFPAEIENSFEAPEAGLLSNLPHDEVEEFEPVDEVEEEPVFRLYRVHMRSAPGMWATYDGHVDIHAPHEGEAFARAVAELGRTSFPDRKSLGLSAWRLERVEALS